ncbi:aldehyde dehydrogenase family protein [Actinomadura sp. 3N508]|uniref:aldehyde dehydrogenase family protein n=1 Tax=Actinomadura sp. 3N508 TaxID=3375153 RepID=UPI0037BAF68D
MTATDEARRGAPAVRMCELFVGGRWTAAEHGRTVQTRSELAGKPVADVAVASPADVRRAVEAAERGFGTWAGRPPARRRAVLERAAALFAERADDLASLMREEMGTARPWCESNVSVARGMLAEAAAQAYSAVGEVIPSDVPGLTALGVRQPVGGVVGIAPRPVAVSRCGRDSPRSVSALSPRVSAAPPNGSRSTTS